MSLSYEHLDKLVLTLTNDIASLQLENAALKAKVANFTSTNNERIANCAFHVENRRCNQHVCINFCGDVPCRILIAQSASVS